MHVELRSMRLCYYGSGLHVLSSLAFSHSLSLYHTLQSFEKFYCSIVAQCVLVTCCVMSTRHLSLSYVLELSLSLSPIALSNRTLMDLVIALGHIVAMIFHLSEAESFHTLIGCKVIGVINEMALVASSFWYVMLAVDLIKAIRNPFR